MVSRFQNLLKKAAPVIAAGAALLFLAFIGLGVPCLFHMVTGLYCPGCGTTRMVLALLRLDFAGAFGYNPGMMIAVPILGLVIAVSLVRYLLTGRKKVSLWQTVVIWALAAFLVGFGVVRNLPAYPQLRPPETQSSTELTFHFPES